MDLVSTLVQDADQEQIPAKATTAAVEASALTSPASRPPLEYPVLQLGHQNCNVSEIKSQWLRYNHRHVPRKDVIVMVSDSKKGFWKSICACVKGVKTIKDWKENRICHAHIFLSMSTVKSIDLNHSCTDDDAGRKRNYNTRQIHMASDQLFSAMTSTNKRSRRLEAAQNYIEAAEKEGFSVGRIQAYNIVSRMSRQPIESQIGEFYFLTSLFTAWKRADPDGSYVLEKTQCSWKPQQPSLEQFQRYYIAPSISKHAWKNSHVHLFISDACDTSKTWTSFQMTLLMAATLDGNNQVVVLALALCDTNSELNWLWFLHNLMRDFTKINIFLSSSEHVTEGKHIPNLLTLMNAAPSRCIHSLIVSLEKAFMKQLTTEEKEEIHQLARSTSAEAYHHNLRRLSSTKANVAAFLDARKQKFVAYWLLQSSQKAQSMVDRRQRFGEIASQVNDLVHNQVMEITDQPVASMTTSLLMKISELHLERKLQALRWLESGTLLSAYARNIYSKIIQESQGWKVQLSGHDGNVWCAIVTQPEEQEGISSNFVVSANTASFQMDCSCRFTDEMGFPCVHGTALLRSQNLILGADARWFHPRYLASTLLDMYDSDPPDFSVFGKVTVDELIPPDHIQSSGKQTLRKPNNNTVPAATSAASNLHKCAACGKQGHHPTTCPQPSTKYRYNQFSDKAMVWANAALDLHS